jgi:hypothetical protein
MVSTETHVADVMMRLDGPARGQAGPDPAPWRRAGQAGDGVDGLARGLAGGGVLPPAGDLDGLTGAGELQAADVGGLPGPGLGAAVSPLAGSASSRCHAPRGHISPPGPDSTTRAPARDNDIAGSSPNSLLTELEAVTRRREALNERQDLATAGVDAQTARRAVEPAALEVGEQPVNRAEPGWSGRRTVSPTRTTPGVWPPVSGTSRPAPSTAASSHARCRGPAAPRGLRDDSRRILPGQSLNGDCRTKLLSEH